MLAVQPTGVSIPFVVSLVRSPISAQPSSSARSDLPHKYFTIISTKQPSKAGDVQHLGQLTQALRIGVEKCVRSC